MSLIKNISKTTGAPSGRIVQASKKRKGKVTIELIDYTESDFKEIEIERIEDVFDYKEKDSCSWININGVHDTNIIERLGKKFDIHPIVLDDIVNIGQRSKFDNFDKYIFIVLKMFYIKEKTNEIIAEQISFILGDKFVISFQEEEGDVFDFVRDKIRKSKGRIRKMKSDYLLYALIDAIIDGYFIVIEKLGEDIESLEEKLIKNPGTETLLTIHSLKMEMIFLRKSIWPLREVMSAMAREESVLISKDVVFFVRELYDHVIQVMDTVEAFRDMVSGMLEIYLSSLSNKMNEVMKVLTIIATIFIPLTFVAGIYGMNFKFMPELEWKFGYIMFWGIIFSIGLLMVIYFRKKKWL